MAITPYNCADLALPIMPPTMLFATQGNYVRPYGRHLGLLSGCIKLARILAGVLTNSQPTLLSFYAGAKGAGNYGCL